MHLSLEVVQIFFGALFLSFTSQFVVSVLERQLACFAVIIIIIIIIIKHD